MKPLLVSLVGMMVGTGCVTLPTGKHPWAGKTPSADNVRPVSEKQGEKARKVTPDEIDGKNAVNKLREIETEISADEL